MSPGDCLDTFPGMSGSGETDPCRSVSAIISGINSLKSYLRRGVYYSLCLAI